MFHRKLFVATTLFMVSCTPDTTHTLAPIAVEIAHTESGYQLLRGGEPYLVKGAGMAVDDMERFAAHGGNSVRTWSTTDEHQATRSFLDSAYANGVSVALGLPMQAERHGFDYHDSLAVSRQLESMRREVAKYKDHPAVLAWIIGNELNHSYRNPAVFDAVNDVAEMIHELDPNHPATTALAGFDASVLAEVQARAPALDFISFQTYGSLFGLKEKIEAVGFDAPFMVTEWGTIGYWEMETTTWGAPVELTSSEKADVFLRANREVLSSFEGQLLGSYVFFWGQKQERTPTWFGLLTEAGDETEVVDVMHYQWNGSWPLNRTPRVNAMLLDGKDSKQSVTLRQGESYNAVFNVVDPDGDALTYHWDVKPESGAIVVGGDFEDALPSLTGVLVGSDTATITLIAPEPGSYRLFAYARDGEGHVAHANIPFSVQAGLRQSGTDLLAGEVMGVAYSGFREGQHPDRGNGAVNPADHEILEDLNLLVANGFRLIRLYDSGENSRATLTLIRAHDLPIKVLLGTWLDAEISNHLGCPWLDEPIPEETLLANRQENAAELKRGIELAKAFADIVVALNVGNEALVDWNDHMVPLDTVISYVRQVKAAIEQPVTVADNYEWWAKDGKPLADVVDFLGVHTYPVWEEKSVGEAMAYTEANILKVREALPDKPIAILEAGWATTATEFGDRANEENQVRYFRDLMAWADTRNVTTFFFEAFDEPWKGDPGNPEGAEKHWGVFTVDRLPKKLITQLPMAPQTPKSPADETADRY